MKKIIAIYLLSMVTASAYAATSIAPIDCANKGYNGRLDLTQSVALCSGATSNAPIKCANKAYEGRFDLNQSVRLCKSSLVFRI